MVNNSLSYNVLNHLKENIFLFFKDNEYSFYRNLPISEPISAGVVSVCPYFNKDSNEINFYYAVKCANGTFKCPSDFLFLNEARCVVNTASNDNFKLYLTQSELIDESWQDNFRKKVADFIISSKDVIDYIQNITDYFKYYSFDDDAFATFTVSDWKIASEFSELTDSVVNRFADKLDWFIISADRELDEIFIEKYSKYMNWIDISARQTLSEGFIEKHKTDIDWDMISLSQVLSYTFIEKYADRLNWDYIARSQVLKETFIEKHFNRFSADGIDNISKYQSLSIGFIMNHLKDNLNLKYIVDNPNISTKLRDFIRSSSYYKRTAATIS